MTSEYGVVLVDSTSHALRIEKLLGMVGLPCKLIPVPRHLSSDCGVCVRIMKSDSEKTHALLNENKIVFQSFEVL